MDCLSPAHYEDNFQLDDLLDFPNDEEDDNENEEENQPKNSLNHERETEETSFGLPVHSMPPKANQNGSASLLGIAKDGERHEFTAFFQEAYTSGILCAPPDDLALQLEWLSAFNEDDSYTGDTALTSLVSSGSRNMQAHHFEKAGEHDKFESSSPVSVLEERNILPGNSYYTNVPSRARSKRSRNGGKIWSCDTLMPILLDNNRQVSFIEEIDFSSSILWHDDNHQQQLKKPKPKRFHHKNTASTRDVSPPRRCSHCLVQKTPQWRAGPMGPKTLCNACGVRYKSGRLLPEYRPAGSPSFMSEIHSNSHKKVLEMRRLKEMEGAHPSPASRDDNYGDSKAASEETGKNNDIECVSRERKKSFHGSPRQGCGSVPCEVGDECADAATSSSVDQETSLE